jgi:hypothetical protein
MLLELLLKEESDKRLLLLHNYETVHFPSLYLIYSPALYLPQHKEEQERPGILFWEFPLQI